MEQIASYIQQYIGDFWVAAVSMLPIVELRAAIPLAHALGIPSLEALALAIVGNMIPVVPIVLCGRGIINLLKRIPPLHRFAEKIEQRTLKNKDKIYKYSLAGLVLIVAIPLPGTGAWTGSLLAALMDIRLKVALPAIFAGVCISGVIVTVLCYIFGLLI